MYYEILRGSVSICLLLLNIGLTGCSMPTAATSYPPKPSVSTPRLDSAPPAPKTEQQGQQLPISARMNIGGQIIELEVARTSAEQSMGLMYRMELQDNRGMLFPFSPPRPVRFWMKNVSISLDMVFLRDGEVKEIVENVPPCTSDPCPVYGPPHSVAIDRVIELRGGRAAELGLQVGARLDIEFLEPATKTSR
jgi:uncharacterized protein